jgi:hypothetical protein
VEVYGGSSPQTMALDFGGHAEPWERLLYLAAVLSVYRRQSSSRLRRDRDGTELLEKAQRIHQNPLLGDLAAGQAEDLHRLEPDLTSRRRHA